MMAEGSVASPGSAGCLAKEASGGRIGASCSRAVSVGVLAAFAFIVAFGPSSSNTREAREVLVRAGRSPPFDLDDSCPAADDGSSGNGTGSGSCDWSRSVEGRGSAGERPSDGADSAEEGDTVGVTNVGAEIGSVGR